MYRYNTADVHEARKGRKRMGRRREDVADNSSLTYTRLSYAEPLNVSAQPETFVIVRVGVFHSLRRVARRVLEEIQTASL
jgi:hypothetical protein